MTKNVVLKSLRIENFGNIKDRTIEFGNKTLIKGRNESGKTTINDAYSWLLNDKLANGNKADGIRPHDKNNIEDDNALISVMAVFDIDDSEKVITKEQRKEFAVKSGKFKGNNNTYLIGNIPKKEKEYKAYLEEKIIDPDKLELCTNASAFLNKDTKNRRQILFELIDNLTDLDVAKTDSRFTGIPSKLEDCTLEELIQSIKFQINGRGRGEKGLKGRQEELPARINEANRQVGDIAEYELAISALEKEVEELNKKDLELADASKAFDEKSSKLFELKFKQSDISKAANESLIRAKKKIIDEEYALRSQKKEVERELQLAEIDLRNAESGINNYTTEITKAQKDWKSTSEKEFDDSLLKKIKAETFDESTLTCPTCGQNLPEDQAEKIRNDFQDNKNKRIAEQEEKKKHFYEFKDIQLSAITDSGNRFSEKLKECKQLKSEAEKKISELKAKIELLNNDIRAKEVEEAQYPDSVDLSENKEYQEITAEIAKAEAELKAFNDGSEQRREISRLGNEKIAEISRYKTLISESQKAQGRVDELIEEQKGVAQKLADCQQELDILRDFQKKKCEMITAEVNKLFKFTKWELFKMNLDGEGYVEICEPTFNGTKYGTRLNSGAKILIEADICNTFQNVNEVSLPIWIDDAESVSEETMKKIEEFDRQLIFLKVDECDLKVV